jgi:hypothetical protein
MPVSIKVNKDLGINVKTAAERDAGQVGIDVSRDVGVDVRPTVGISIINNRLSEFKFDILAREALNGDIMIFEHRDIDIVIMQEKKKVVAFAKEMLNDNVYGAEKRLFDHLKKTGIVQYDSIQGGNVYGSMEAVVLDSKKYDPMKSALIQISEWCKSEKPSSNFLESHDDMMQDNMLNPDDEYATELGEVPHEEEKGSILQKNLFAPYLYGRYTY